MRESQDCKCFTHISMWFYICSLVQSVCLNVLLPAALLSPLWCCYKHNRAQVLKLSIFIRVDVPIKFSLVLSSKSFNITFLRKPIRSCTYIYFFDRRLSLSRRSIGGSMFPHNLIVFNSSWNRLREGSVMNDLVLVTEFDDDYIVSLIVFCAVGYSVQYQIQCHHY